MIGESLLARYRAAGKYPRIIMLVLIAVPLGTGYSFGHILYRFTSLTTATWVMARKSSRM
jgi:hypothetical protein